MVHCRLFVPHKSFTIVAEGEYSIQTIGDCNAIGTKYRRGVLNWNYVGTNATFCNEYAFTIIVNRKISKRKCVA